jgi:hypothetical protein
LIVIISPRELDGLIKFEEKITAENTEIKFNKSPPPEGPGVGKR